MLVLVSLLELPIKCGVRLTKNFCSRFATAISTTSYASAFFKRS